MDLLRAVVLGIVQGLTEFLPVSSSGHLILIPALFNWPDQGLTFDVGLHLGTLTALLVYFWRDWWNMARSALADVARYGPKVKDHCQQSQLLWLIALGSVPAGVAGLLLENWVEENVRQPWLVAVMLACVGVVMLAADRRARLERTVASVGVLDAVLIGLAQACALVPGVSRSGATITVGLMRGLTRGDAARFAFLLGTPAFAGAALLKAPDLAEANGQLPELALGFATSALVGLAAIHFLLRLLRTRDLVPFVVYRFAVAALALAIGAVRVA